MAKRFQNPRRVPSFETVESRTLLNGAGVNLEFNWSYHGDSIWTEVSNAMLAWNSPDRSLYWKQDPTIPTSPQGYALRDASASVHLDNYPDGLYQVSFKGTVEVEFWGIGKLTGPLVRGADGVTRGQILVSKDNQHIGDRRLLVMAVSSIDVNDPMSDLEIWSPGYEPGGQLYTNEFLASLQPFDHIRFLNWTFSNNTTVTDWSELRPEGAFPRTNSSRANALPYEHMIQLANEAGKDMWLNVPALANDQYVENLARLVREKLDPGLKIYIEYSNETWNRAFAQYSQVLALANANPLVTATNDTLKVGQESALQLKRVSDIFRAEFGDSFDRVIPVFAGWTITPDFLKAGLQRVEQLYGDPSQYIKATAIAPYISNRSATSNSSLSVSKAFEVLNAGLDKWIPYIRQNAQIAAAYGLPLDAYEGGIDSFLTGIKKDVLEAVYEDPRLYDLYRRYDAEWRAAGGRQMTYFTYNGPAWGLKPLVSSPGGQRWDAVMSLLLQPGDANLDGVVDFADFQILAANYSQSGRWWEQGDFNHDGVVDDLDLEALVSRLDLGSLTADQAVQILTLSPSGLMVADQALELGLFARKYASDFSFAASSNHGGPIVRNGVFNGGSAGGGKMTLGGVTHDRGLGVSSNSSVDLRLDGGFTTFSSTIGVDDRAGRNNGRATFQVIGDGRVLYASPVMRSGDEPLAIEVDVRGVRTLRLVVTSPEGSAQSAPADWAQARLIDSRSDGGGAPFRFQWTAKKNGALVASEATESFVFSPRGLGDHVLTVQATDRWGGVASRNVALDLRAGDADFLGQDSSTRGTWMGTYGGEGYTLAGDAYNAPPGSTITLSGQNSGVYYWTRSTSPGSRALQRATWGRTASAWYGNEFFIDVAFNDGESHKVSLYGVDWDSTTRSQRIDVIDAVTGRVIDSRTMSSFQNGAYLTWEVSGNVRFRITKLAGANAVIGGIFVDESDRTPPAPPEETSFVGADSSTRGTWKGVYGDDGYVIVGDATNTPSHATLSVSGHKPSVSQWSWKRSTTDARGLQKATASDRLAVTWYGDEFFIDVAFNDGESHKVSLYGVDWDSTTRSQRIDVIDPATGEVIDSRTMSSFHDGAYLTWEIRGSVRFRITKLAGANAVIGGVFFD